MNKKILIIPLMMLLLCISVLATGNLVCTTYTDAGTTFSDVISFENNYTINNTQYENCTGGTITTFRPTGTTTPVLQMNVTCLTDDNHSYNMPTSKPINLSVSVYNGTNNYAITEEGNFSINYLNGTFTVLDTCVLNNTIWNINMSIDLLAGVTDVTSDTLLYANYGPHLNTAAGEGANRTFYVSQQTATFNYLGLNATAFTVAYTYSCDDNCTWYESVVSESCENTQATIFAAFGLIALIGLVGAAFALIGIFSGSGENTGTFIAVGVGLVALAIVVSIGYFIIAQVGSSVCTLGPTS